MSLLEEIDDFVAKKYAPFIVGHVIENSSVLKDFKKTINSGNKEEIKEIFTAFVLAAYDQFELKKVELKQSKKSQLEPRDFPQNLKQIIKSKNE